MTLDRRLLPATDRVALESLRGVVDRPEYTPGRPAQVGVPMVDLLASPGGRRDRQLNFGADLTVIERQGDWAFVQAAMDGYCGWVRATALRDEILPVTHRVIAPATHVYPGSDMKLPEAHGLSFGAALSVNGYDGRFARLRNGGFVPIQHIGDAPLSDPVALAEAFLGTPYLWGGNSRWGIDCSGLVQMALTACGIPCPGDSDLQRDAFPAVDDIRRGDLLFWPGHVAMACSADLMVHATAWRMAVVHEPIAEARARIEAAGEGPFLGIRRPRLQTH